MTYSKGTWRYDAESGEVLTSDRTGFWGPDHEPVSVCTVTPLDGVNNGPLLAAATDSPGCALAATRSKRPTRCGRSSTSCAGHAGRSAGSRHRRKCGNEDYPLPRQRSGIGRVQAKRGMGARRRPCAFSAHLPATPEVDNGRCGMESDRLIRAASSAAKHGG